MVVGKVARACFCPLVVQGIYCDSVSDRLLTASIRTEEDSMMHVLVGHAPTSDKDLAIRAGFYDSVSGVVDKWPDRNMVIVFMDANATLCRSDRGVRFVLDCQFGNPNRALLSDIMSVCRLWSTVTLFRKRSHQLITFCGS